MATPLYVSDGSDIKWPLSTSTGYGFFYAQLSRQDTLKYVSKDKIDLFNRMSFGKQQSILCDFLDARRIIQWCNGCFRRKLGMMSTSIRFHSYSMCYVESCTTRYCLDCRKNDIDDFPMCDEHTLFLELYKNLEI